MKIALLHALPFDQRIWEDQLPALAEHEVFAPRLYDLGSSIDEWALGVLQQVPGPLVAVGASMGGYTAAGIARLAPERLQGLVLSGSLAGADPPERAPVRERWIQIATERGGEGMWEEVAPAFFPPDTDPSVLERAHAIAAEQEPAGLVRAIEAIRDRPDSTDAVVGWDGPLLVVAGDHDPLVTPEIAYGLAAASPNARAEVLEGCGHLPNMERPHEFNRMLTSFLDSL
jgi:pimeloyl-ACP methyl ester carboxylesterase